MTLSNLRYRRTVATLSLGILAGLLVLWGAASLRAEPDRHAIRSAVLHVSERNFEKHVLQADMPVLVDFYASWCGPCQKLGPTIEQVAAETPHARVVKVNVDDNPRLARRYDIRSLPSLLVFNKGRVVAYKKGVVAKKRIKAMLDL